MEPNIQNTPAFQAAEPQIQRIGKMKGSYLLIVESLRILRAQKGIVLFPILSGISSLAFAGIVITLGHYFYADAAASSAAAQQDPFISNIISYGSIFILYLVSAFIAAFFQAGLITVVHAKFNGKTLGFSDGFQNALLHAKKIFIWSLLSATVGVIIKVISDKSEWVGKLIMGFVGVAWGIATLFIVPVILFEDRSIKDSVKRSADIFGKTWGETIIMNFSTNFFMVILVIIAFFAYVGLAATGIIPMIGGAILLAAFFIILGIISSAITSIYKVALYEYAANGKIPDAFTPELITQAIKQKK